MSVFQKVKTIVNSFPALEIVELEKQESFGYTHINLVAGDVVQFEGGRSRGSINSVASYALENGDCPFSAKTQAEKFNHKLYWINQNCVVISDRLGPKTRSIQIQEGELVCFEGKFFHVMPDYNDNFKLEEFDILNNLK